MTNDELLQKLREMAAEKEKGGGTCCPSCGHCPTCGHTPWQRLSPYYPYVPMYPTYPQVTYTDGVGASKTWHDVTISDNTFRYTPSTT